jgi:hypothetical protein
METENSFSSLGDLEVEEKDPNESVVERQSNLEGKRLEGKDLPPLQDSGDIPEAQEAGKEVESSEEEEDEFDISQTSPKFVTRGQKMEKERRETTTYKDMVQGSQPTLDKMLKNTRSVRHQGNPSKGASTNPRSK